MIGYVKRYSTEQRDNYFSFINEDYNDSLFFEDILDGTFSSYTEQLSSAESEFNCVCSAFAIGFSLSDSIRSNENNLTVKEFFKPSDNTRYKYALSLDLGNKIIGGVMDNEETTVDKSFMSGRWDITLNFFTWEGELANFCIAPPRLTGGVDIDNFITSYLFRGVNNGINDTPRLSTDLNFNWSSRLGYTPKIIWEAYNEMLANGISENGWQLFKELAYGLGFIFKLKTEGLVPLNTHFIKVVLWCGWRSEGINHREIQMLEPHTETNQINSAKFLMLFYRHDTQPDQVRVDSRYAGLMKSKDDLYINDAEKITVGPTTRSNFYNVDSEDFLSAGVTIQCKGLIRNLDDDLFPLDYTPVSSVKQVHRIYYFINKAGNAYFFKHHLGFNTVAFARLFVQNYSVSESFEIDDIGWFSTDFENTLIYKTAGVEYDFLIAGNKNIINTDIHFDTNIELEVFDIVTVNEVDYWVRRITGINLTFDPQSGQRASVELVEI
jgi:hypothetical protein